MKFVSTGLYRKIRVAIINNSLENKYHSYGDHWVDGFEDAGCEVEVFRYEDIKYIPIHFDLYFFVEVRYDPKKIPWCLTPRVLYSWDAHVLGTSYYEPISTRFDTIYLASKIDAEKLNESGHRNVRWLPEACNPRIHKNSGDVRSIDIGFVGKGNGERKRNGFTKNDFLKWLKESSFKTIVTWDKWGESYVRIMNSSRVAFDRVIAHNVGTRVFESAAMGCVPLWADSGISEQCGMSQLMKPWEHYVPYDDTIESLENTLKDLFGKEEKFKRIAKQAESHVLSHHTYAHRAREVISHQIPGVLQGSLSAL